MPPEWHRTGFEVNTLRNVVLVSCNLSLSLPFIIVLLKQLLKRLTKKINNENQFILPLIYNRFDKNGKIAAELLQEEEQNHTILIPSNPL